MKIEKSGKSLPVGPMGEGQARAPAAKTSGQSQTAPASTSVHLGESAAQLQSMQGSMANSPVVDAAKVAQIKQAISEGRFQVTYPVFLASSTLNERVGLKATPDSQWHLSGMPVYRELDASWKPEAWPGRDL